MKKVFTILAIMIVAACAVFAEEPAKTDANGSAKITIDVLIGEEFPRFQLATKTGASSKTSAVSKAVEASTIVEDAPEATMADTEKAKLTQKDGVATVVFSVNQIAKARCFAKYEMVVTATDLVLVKSADGTINDGTADKGARSIAAGIADTEKKHKFTVVDEIEHVANDTADVTEPDDENDGSKIVIKYEGVLVGAKADNTDDTVEIGTATVKWNANVDAMAGEYKAQVTLSVTAQ